MILFDPSAVAADAALFSRMADGDREAFAQFYDAHSTLLFSLALKILRDPHEAEEAFQEAMLLIWERAATYDASLGKPLSWAVTLTRNKAIDRLRSAQRKSRLVADAIEAAVFDPAASAAPPDPAFSHDAIALMRRELAALPGEQRQVIELAFFGGLTHAEIAAKTGQPLGTIKARIRRGMMHLRDALEGCL